MGVRIRVGELDYEAIDYSVEENATPLSAGDSSGGVGAISFTIPRPDPDIQRSTIEELLVEDPNNPGFLVEVS